MLDPVTERRFSSWRRALVALKSELAAIKAELEAKANFDPNQPRDENGRWTREGGEVERPEQPLPRTPDPDILGRIIRHGIGTVIRLVQFLYDTGRKIDATVNADLYIEAGKPPQVLDVLRNDVATRRPGTEVHHIVEQNAWNREGFGSIQDRDGWFNTVRISTLRHREITGWYQRGQDELEGLSPREWLVGRSWNDHYEMGLRAMRRAGVLLQ